MRLSYGELDWPNSEARQIFVRAAFLDAIANHAPEVCQSLYSEVLPSYRIAQDTAVETRDAHNDRIYVPLPAEALALERALAAWARTYQLELPWHIDAALKTLTFWSALETQPARLDFQWVTLAVRALLILQPLLRNGARGPTVIPPPPPASLPEYTPLTQLRVEYLGAQRLQALRIIQTPPLCYSEQSQQKAFADSINASEEITNYCIAVENIYLENGYSRRSQGEKRDLFTHLEWTVRSRIKGESQSDIARERQLAGLKGATESAISQAIGEILEIINNTAAANESSSDLSSL